MTSKTLRRCLLLALMPGLAILVTAAPAFAHASLVRADPKQGSTVQKAPDAITLEFNEGVELRFGGIRVFDSNLDKVPLGEPEQPSRTTVRVPLKGLEKGTYSVAWKVISADAHPVQGAYTFAVGEPGDTPRSDLQAALQDFGSVSPAVVAGGAVARFAGYVTSLVLLGGLAFLLLSWRPPEDAGAGQERLTALTRRLLVRAWQLGLLADVLILITQAANESSGSLLQGLSPSTIGPVLSSHFGRVWMVRTVLLLVVILLIRTAVKVPLRKGRLKGAALVSAGVMVSPAFWGHATTLKPAALGVTADALHTLAVGVWIGGLLMLLLVLPRALRDTEPEVRAATMAATVPRFSTVAFTCVVFLTASGSYLAIEQVKSWGALFGTTYGKLVLGKIGGLALIVLLASFNLFRTRKGLQSTADDPARSESWSLKLKKAVRGELLIATAVIALAAVLVSIPPASSSSYAPESFEASAKLGDGLVTATLAPARVGKAEAHFYVLQANGAPVENLVDPKVVFTQTDQGLGPFEYRGLMLAPGHFTVTGIDLPVTGNWKMYMIVTKDKFTALDHTFNFRVS